MTILARLFFLSNSTGRMTNFEKALNYLYCSIKSMQWRWISALDKQEQTSLDTHFKVTGGCQDFKRKHGVCC